MKTLLHLSDLHFGRVNESLVEPFLAAAGAVSPDLVVISGDLTQRARTVQFRAARAFLGRLPQPQLVVPGNHDIPLWDVIRRFVSPLGRYRHYIAHDLAPFYQDEEIAVLGINTARSLTREYGRISERQMAQAREAFAGVGPEVVKMVVTHHPFDLPPGSRSRLVGRAGIAMRELAEARIDVLLAGHLHLRHTALTAPRYSIEGHSALVVQAGTTTSTRDRGEANSFNVVRVDHSEITIDHYLWSPEEGSFTARPSERFQRGPAIWRRAP